MPENIIKKETLEGQYLVILSSQGLFYTIKSASRGYMLADFRRGGMKPFRKHSAEQLIIGNAVAFQNVRYFVTGGGDILINL